LPQGELGEIVVKGPCLMNGYLGLAKDEQPIDENGWLHTADIGVITKDGLLQIKGRAKSLIKRAGEGIAPADVEEALLEDSRILDAKVMGVPHPILGESIEACVVLRNGEEFDERRLRASMRRKLSPHKIPSHIVAFRSFPLNSNGKVDVLRLKEMLLDRLSDLLGE
jgi:fatty-acyl-CoA synthase